MKQFKMGWSLFGVLLTFVLVVGCANTDNRNDLQDFPDIGIPVKNPNQVLKITIVEGISSLKNNNRIIFLVENLSQSIISIEPGKDVKIFKKLDSGWEPVQNMIDYNQAVWPVMPKGGEIPNVYPIDVYPGLKDISDPMILRIVVIGKSDNFLAPTTVSFVDTLVNP
jgi:hypothetical protein